MAIKVSEKHLVINRLKFSYEGLFRVDEFYGLIGDFFYERNWDWYEKTNQELVTEEGRQIRIILEPWKSISDFYKINMKIQLHLVNVKDVEVEKDGQPVHLEQGVVRLVIDGFVTMDRNKIWGSTKGWLFYIMMNFYFFNNHLKKFETYIKNDVDEMMEEIKNYFNVYKYSYHG
jgi:hypothetical protein